MTSALPVRMSRLLVAAVVALAVPVAGTGPTSAAPSTRPVTARMTSLALTPQSADRAARLGGAGAAESPVVETGGALRVVGVTWPEGAVAATDRVEIRQRAKGTWGSWAPLDADDDDAPDPGSAEAVHARGGTDPFITTGDAVQVRVIGKQRSSGRSARLDVVDPRASAADAAPGAAGAAAAGAVRPTIYTRAQWGADESLKRSSTASYGVIKAAVVHHTAGSNSYTADQVPAILRGIYDFHVNGRGWNDIGYNFLIDKFGRIWEGRAGGVDLPVVGAQAAGFNSQTFGTSTLGDFTSVSPPSAVVTAHAKIAAWKLGLAHVDPTATTVIDGKGTLPTVIGHRNLNDTTCPGTQLYARLADIRTAARAYQGTMLYGPTLSPTSIAYGGGSSVTLGARASTSVRWTLSVSSVCRTDVQFSRSGTASATTRVSATWDGRLADGTPAPPGDYRLTLTANSGSGALATSTPVVRTVSVASAVGAPAGFCPPRLSGADRYATAVAVARAQAPSSTTVVVASGEDAAMVDALVAAPLARAKGAALLLTPAAGLASATSAEVARRGATTAYLVGGTGAVSDTVRQQLVSLGVTTVTRVAGSDRYSTAGAVAGAMGGPRPEVMVASGEEGSTVDGLVLSGPAAHLGAPVLLVGRDRVPGATQKALSALGATSTVVAGGTGVVSDAVVAALPRAVRVAGTSRYTTATAVGSWAASHGVPVDVAALAAGVDGALVDMLSAGQLGRVTMITPSTTLSSATDSWLRGTAGTQDVVVVGGEAVVSAEVAGEARAAAGS